MTDKQAKSRVEGRAVAELLMDCLSDAQQEDPDFIESFTQAVMRQMAPTQPEEDLENRRTD